MRQGPMSVLLCLLLLSPFAAAEQPLSLEAGARITELQQRLEESEKQRTLLAQQMQSQDSERESAQLSRLRQDNQRLKLAIKELQAAANPVQRLLTDQQQWFLIGSAVALLSVVCGILASGGHRRRRQWLN
ncbi:translation initiation factor 2 [Pseudomonas sichuanensis]|uniref:translation initiation factor 2 n=1 Tax=Pseudomonas TaxID=286 RepID=UPI00129B80A5|nr:MULTISPECIES: translation initiation factor 2 [Pseudomonas]MDH0729397.1 translation initiation factor 2 [Pseudomonas sichuanensis]MDH1583164.1 translation initiation factor 2 [Pseudomonas sichuanensis]MDH1590734.1 translation initiation factor 2 [Pseudomonas sichuanensis]MDH1596069.1 translation initiation factor 2 [Pseudomonas sichuanensis]MDU9401703.1 translation initiation factor 2 [Pseudomonas sp. zfem004]